MTGFTRKSWRERGSPRLTGRARRYLKERGIKLSLAREVGLRSLKPKETAAIWGPDCEFEALLIPYSDDYATARIFWRSKKLEKQHGKFRTTPGMGTRIYEPPVRFDWDKVAEDPSKYLLIVEGPIKALAAVGHGLRAIGISGAYNWQLDRVAARRLRQYDYDKRRVIPVFDADISENNSVLLAYLLFGDWLQSQGADVRHVRIPKSNARNQGLDDLLARGGKAAWKELRRYTWESEKVLALRNTVQRTTEGGLAALFKLQHSLDVRFDSNEGDWYSYEAPVWMKDSRRAPHVQERMKKTVWSIVDLANRVTNSERRTRMLRWASRCDSKNAIRGAMELASSDPDLQVTHDLFDTEPYLLGTQSGVVDLRTGAILEQTKEHMVSKRVAAAYDPDAPCPRWRKFISEIMMKDVDMAAFMKRLAGYFLLGSNPERLIFFLYGVGRNGKSVFIETLLRLMGEYGEPAKSDLIMRKRVDRDAESAQPFMLKLRGKRYITASEVGEGMHLDAATVKTLTGGDEMTVRGLHAAPVRFTVNGKFVIRCNTRVIIDGADQAIWDRVVEIPFDLRLGDDEQDRSLRDVLNKELPGILTWAVEGCGEYLVHGLQIPEKVLEQTKAYRSAMDSVSRWLKECTTREYNARSLTTALYSHYSAWCQRQSQSGVLLYPVDLTEFGKKLKDAGFVKKKHKGLSQMRGIALLGGKP